MSERRCQSGARWGIVLILALTSGAPAIAQTVIPSESPRVARLFASLDDLIEGEQWDRALDLLEQISTTERDAVVRVGAEHLLNAAELARWRLSNLPPPLLARYRARWEPRAAAWLAAAEADPHADRRQQIVEEAFATRAAERAILRWGDERLQRGEFEQARQLWQMLLPDPSAGRSRLLRFPDPETPRADVLARLILCSRLAGDTDRAARELDWFAERFPDAQGTLAGKQGRWHDLLRALPPRTDLDRNAIGPTAGTTFGGTSTRNARSAAPLDVGAIAWTRTLPVGGWTTTARGPRRAPPARCFPGQWNGITFLSTGEEIHAVRTDDGSAAWTSPPATGNSLGGATRLYPPLGESRRDPSQPLVGTAAETITLAGGRLYARLGGPITSPSDFELQPSQSRLVCLDVAESEGLLLWEQTAGAIDARLQFEGSPIVSGERLLLLGRRGPAPAQLHLICLDARDGGFLWNREICSGPVPAAAGENFASHHLLAAFGDVGYINTEVGVLAACDLRDGRPLWFHEYERREPSASSRGIAPDHGPAHCVVRDGVVYARPGDGTQLLALDGRLGQKLWSRAVHAEQELLGIVDERVILSGTFLECRSATDGTRLWRIGSTQDDWQTAGRGLITPREVWWPTASEIVVVEHATGQIVRRIPLRDRQGLAGGHLLCDDRSLLIAGPDRLTRLSPFGNWHRSEAKSSGNP